MLNVNTKEYWENRFVKNWKGEGERQTSEYAKANTKYLTVKDSFEGTILDFGCAMGDAIPIYSQFFPKAKLIGFDISENAIRSCKNKFDKIADFYSGELIDTPLANIIIASHVMEHITNDKFVVNELLKKCDKLFVFVPYKENPLFIEHVNYYEDNYYDDLSMVEKKVFEVKYNAIMSFIPFLKNLLKLKISLFNNFSKEIIMFHLKGNGI